MAREYARPYSLRGAILNAPGVIIPRAGVEKWRCFSTKIDAQDAENVKKSVQILLKSANLSCCGFTISRICGILIIKKLEGETL